MSPTLAATLLLAACISTVKPDDKPKYKCGNPIISPLLRDAEDEEAPSLRIVMGTNARRGSWPWQALLRFRLSLDPTRPVLTSSVALCGGTLVNKDWIVTAAHCFDDLPGVDINFRDERRWYVQLGKYNKNMQESTEQTFQVQKLLLYPKYNRSVRYDADIALLKLNESADMTDFVQPICLGKLPPGRRGRELCYITGWGDTENGPYYNGNLNQAQLPALSDKKCSRIYGERGVKLTKNMFCAGETGDPPVPDACSADSGGPLACRYKNRWILYGVTSLGLNGPDRLYSVQSQLPPAFVMPLKEIIADEENVREEQETRQLRCGNGPGIYTDVAKFKKWIERTIRTN